jgi:hypothetical protein
MNCTDFLKIGPYRVEYRGKTVGITLDAPRLDVIPELYEAKCCYTKGKAVRKIISNMKFIVSVELRKTDKDFAELPQKNKSKVIFAESVLTTGGELCLSPVAGKQDCSYCFPKALLVPEAACPPGEAENGCLQLKFEVYEDSEGVLIRKIS